jgi:membrane-associated phospholipid phosphatase
MKRKFVVVVPGALFVFAATFLLASFKHFTSNASFDLGSAKSSLNKWLPSGHSSANTTGEYRG